MNNSIDNTCLTNLSIAGGCGCKLDPQSLKELLIHFKENQISNSIIVGFDTADDCAVYQYDEKDYLLFTTDFFTPLIDDPFLYGSLAAANALSDVFAMGGKPLIANAILGFPPDKLSPNIVRKIIEGAEDKMREAECKIVGGHTIINPQPVYGFSIIGRVDKHSLKKNNGGKDGDLIVLTKPIGSGILSNALKIGLLNNDYYHKLVPWILEVNSIGYELGKIPEVNAMTDVTGFGLVGHLLEMTEGTGLTAQIDGSKIEIFEGVAELASLVLSPQSGAINNYQSYVSKVEFEAMYPLEKKYILCDPQSNGGLLFSVSPSGLEKAQKLLQTRLGRSGVVIGSFHNKQSDTSILRIYG